MSWKYWIKIQGSSESSFNPVNTLSIELPIFGIHPTYEDESTSEVAMSGTEIAQRKIRVALELAFVPVSTWDTGTITTDNVQYLLKMILQRKYTRLIKPDPGANDKKLPDRWDNAVGFPYTTELISSGFVFARCGTTNERKWASGLEQFTMTCYSRDLL